MMTMDFIKKYTFPFLALFIGLGIGYILFSTGNEAVVTHIQTAVAEKIYTCSMHPTVRQEKMGKCPLCGMDLAVISSSDTESLDNQFKMTERALALANVQTSIIGMDAVEKNTIILSGKIQSNDRTNATQTTLFNGRLDKLNIKSVGEYVKKGQQIGTIYSPEMFLAQDKLLTSASYKDSHQKLYAAARNTLGLWKMTDAQIEELLKSGKPLMNFPLYADVSGTVTEVLASEGNYFNQGDALYKVSNLYTVWAVFDAYENQLPFLNPGQEIRIGSNALKGSPINAKITFIEPILDTDKRIVSVRVTLANRDGELKPGMFVEGAVTVDVDNTLLMVPKSSVLWTGERSVVYRKAGADKSVFELVTVGLGDKVGDYYGVLEGLQPGDEIVTNGTFTVDAAAQLQGKKSMLSAQVEDVNTKEMHSGQSIVLNPKLKSTISNLLESYFKLKDNLVAANSEEVQRTSKQMMALLQNVDVGLLDATTGDSLVNIKSNLEIIAKTNDIEGQRTIFKPLSNDMIKIATAYKVLGQPVYVQHCPMADGYKGANWLSLEELIENPYFGDKMLTCGSVKIVL